MASYLRDPDVRLAINRSLSLLRRTYRSNVDEVDYGWYHYLDDPKAGVTASAVALFCFHLAGDNFEHTTNVLNFLKHKQIRSKNPLLDGGWSIRTTASFPVVESTAWVVRALALNQTFFYPDGPSLEKGYNWIINNQNPDCGWGSHKGQPSRIFLTSLSILALASVNRYSKEASLAADWLLSNRAQSTPGWGPLPSLPSTVFHTAFVLLALSEIPGKLPPLILTSSLDWVDSQLNPKVLTEASSQAEEYDVPYTQNGKPMLYQNNLPHFALPIAIHALLKLSNRITSAKIVNGISTIIASQTEDGFWPIPRNPTRPSIWGVWQFLAALTQVRRSPLSAETTDMTMTIIKDAVILQSSKKLRPLFWVLLNSIFDDLKIFIRNKFGWLLLAVFLVGGLFMMYSGWISWQEFVLSLIVPVILLILQLSIERQNDKKR